MNRRDFLFGSLAAAAMASGNAHAGARKPAFLAGARYPDGQYGIEALSAGLDRQTVLKTRHRLHGFSVSPTGKWLVAPARRPGNILVIHDLEKQQTELIEAPAFRHFYGHGVFSISGDYYFATENDFQRERGLVGIYDPLDNFRRIDEIDSGGIGPHEICPGPNGQSLVVANGGILTHPETGRQALNPGAWAPNLTRISLPHMRITDQTSLPDNMSSLSLRHMAMTSSDTVIVGAQDQQAGIDAPPLLWHWRKDGLQPLDSPASGWRAMKGYIGSVAVNHDRNLVAASSPRGNRVLAWDINSHAIWGDWSATDICGLASGGLDFPFVATTGTGQSLALDQGGIRQQSGHNLQFDNHCLAL